MLTREQFLQAKLVEENNDLKLQFQGAVYDLMGGMEETIVKTGVDKLFENLTINTVIEIGFGMGFTAQRFQDHGVAKHYIIEPHPEVFARAEAWRETQPNKENIILINEFWQDWRRLEGIVKITTDLVYYDVAEWVMEDAYDFPRITEEIKPSYFKWGNIIAGYAREACEVLDDIQTISFIQNDLNYIQPYKLNS